MYKVLIADDEIKVCKLICNLVDWKALGLEVIGMAHDGVEALEIIKEHRPHIVLTDIRMPGYDGIELIRRAKELSPETQFIIVSGYRHFDYAHNAIKYGVEDYLLKPLKQAEITQTLQKMLDKKEEVSRVLSEHDHLKRMLRMDKEKMRQILLDMLVKSSKELAELEDLQKVNEVYYCQFVEEYYEGVVIQADLGGELNTEEVYELLVTKTEEIARMQLKEQFQEVLMCRLPEGILVVVNGTCTQFEALPKLLKRIRAEVVSLRDLFQDVKVTFGLGERVSSLIALSPSIANARQAVLQRWIRGRGHIIDVAHLSSSTWDVNDFVNSSVRESLLSTLEILDEGGVRGCVLEVKGHLQEAKEGISGVCVSAVCQELIDTFNFGIKKYKLNLTLEMDKCVRGIYRCPTLDRVFDYLLDCFEEILVKLRTEKERIDTQPIRHAKKYIRTHYAYPLSLEEVSHQVGFNPAYFSALFKKETGQNFSEYLMEVRIKVAKQLLADTNKSLLDVAESVGYNDLKYFSKLFKKVTCLSPSEYRKLYY